MVSVSNIKLEGISPERAFGAVLHRAKPSLSWSFEGQEKDWFQKSYALKVVYGDGSKEEYTAQSNESAYVPWPGKALQSKETISVQLKVFGQDGSESQWSDLQTIQTGFLENSWKAPFIAMKDQVISTHEEKISPEILFRSPEFQLKKNVKSATAYATALGIYELELNGKKVGDYYVAPGWTSYDHRLLHQAYDVTGLLQSENVIAARVAAGWYSGYLGFEGGNSNIYGNQKAISLELDIEYEDGTHDLIETSNEWKSHTGPIVSAQLYLGETYDATKEIEGWSQAKLDTFSWTPVNVVKPKTSRIDPQSFGNVHVDEIIKPIEIITTPKGSTILDFGQNSVGFLRMKPVKGSKGHTTTIKHAEVLEHGELGTRPLREAKNTDSYTFKGASDGESYTPRFTTHGFRYAEIINYPGELTLDSFELLFLSTGMERIGNFECSNKLINQLYSNVFNSARGNFVSIPTDCPQRDERMGWLGDIAMFAPTALYMFDSYPFLRSWLEDLKDEQVANGGFPDFVIPSVLNFYKNFFTPNFCAVWQDAAVIVPWRLFEATKNVDILSSQYDSMKMWYDFLPKLEGKVRWAETKFQLADWLDPSAPPENPLKALTDQYLVADAFLCLIAQQMRDTAEVLGKQDDFKYFSQQAAQAKRDFNDEYVTKNGRLGSDTQTAFSLAIIFGLYENEEQVKHGGERLAKLTRDNEYKISTGFAGTPFVTEALTQTGHAEEAFKMLLEEKCPSWLYPVSMGATTIWERWDSMLEDGSINPGEMTSFNHYALGAVANFLHERIGGIQMVQKGYQEFALKPLLGGQITQAKTSHKSPYGLIKSEWEIKEGIFHYNVQVPPNSKATITLPNGETHKVGSGTYSYTCTL